MTMTGVRLGRKLKIRCLAFADDIAILAESEMDAALQLQTLHETAAKIGLQISYEKTQFMASKRVIAQEIKTLHGTIQKVENFKYLRELLTINNSEKQTLASRYAKMSKALFLTRNIYNKKNISRQAKIRHYQTVIRPEVLYAAECLTMTSRAYLDKIEITERKIIRKILGPELREDGEWHIRHNKDVYSHIEPMSSIIKKRRIQFYGHLTRMDPKRLTSQILQYKESSKNPDKWFRKITEDMTHLKIDRRTLTERDKLRKLLKTGSVILEAKRTRNGGKRVFSEEQRRQQSERMKCYWAAKKKAKNTRS